jgi:uncharacterized protein YodC (DUF2158 family)
MNFSVGDIVQLKSGGPEMTIIGVDTDGGKPTARLRLVRGRDAT